LGERAAAQSADRGIKSAAAGVVSGEDLPIASSGVLCKWTPISHALLDFITFVTTW